MKTISTKALLEQEFALTEKELEQNYRRGYADGWVEAANAISDLLANEVDGNKVAERIAERLYNHWTQRLMPWVWEATSDGAEWPPEIEAAAG